MAEKPIHLRHRILLSRVLAVLLGAGLLVSNSGWDEIPVTSGIVFALGCVLASIAIVGRLWCFLYVSGYKTKALVTLGPYSMCRHPLYFFSLLGALGVGLATETLAIPLVILVIFAVYYPGVIKQEEIKLQGLHGEAFEDYRRRTPSFFPRLSLLSEPEEYMVKPKFVRRHMLDTLWFVWLIGLLEIIESFHEAGILPVLFRLY